VEGTTIKHDVHFYMTFRVKIPGVESEHQLDAINKAFERFNPDTDVEIKPVSGSPVIEAAHADELTSAVVDEVGDVDYSETRAYDLRHGEWILKEIDMVTPLL
jgi:hypothetical protein